MRRFIAGLWIRPRTGEGAGCLPCHFGPNIGRAELSAHPLAHQRSMGGGLADRQPIARQRPAWTDEAVGTENPSWPTISRKENCEQRRIGSRWAPANKSRGRGRQGGGISQMDERGTTRLLLACFTQKEWDGPSQGSRFEWTLLAVASVVNLGMEEIKCRAG